MLQESPMYAYIPAKDMARARKFYEQTLGFKPKQEENGGVVYEFGKHTACFMYPTPNAGTSAASQAFWSVKDVDREIVELKARGVVFEQYDAGPIKTDERGIATPGPKQAWFKDPAANILSVIQE